MKTFFLFFITIFFFSCAAKQEKPPALPEPGFTATVIPVNYDSCKNNISSIKKKNKAGWGKFSKTDKERIFTKAVAETIVPGWIGTRWDFNGTSETPQQGTIACGYFVTTVLRDAGLNLARIKLAQCASEQMLTTLIQPKYIQRFSNVAIENFIGAVQQQGYGLYLIGLDNHTGFIYNDGITIYFIHSTFVGTGNVQKEKAAASQVLRQSKYKVLGKISADEKVLERWIRQGE